MPGSQAEYDKVLAENMKRYGGDRDRAVRTTNVKMGYGNSTASRGSRGGGKDQGAAAPAKAGGGGGGGKKTKKAKSGSPYKLPQETNVTPTARPNPVGIGNTVRPEPPAPIYEPGGGQMPAQNLVRPEGPVGPMPPPQPDVPMNPALSQASVLQTVPPALRGPTQPNAAMGLSMQPTNRPADPFATMLQGMDRWQKPEVLGGGQNEHVFPNFHPASIFQMGGGRRW